MQSTSSSKNAEDTPVVAETLPLPPIVKVKGHMFPTFPEMLKTSKEVGKIFTYDIVGRRMTIITDPKAYRYVFFAKDSDEVELDSAKLAHHWFGINKDLAREYTRPGLDATRKSMSYAKMLKANNEVGEHIMRYIDSLPSKGENDLWNLAMLTFVPVVHHLFGEETFPTAKCPHVAQTLWDYDEDFKKVANGVPRKYYPEMEKRAQEISDYFVRSLDKGLHLKDESACPVLKARISVIPENKFSVEDRARFVFSVFWASQGNTIPGTFWMLALIASNERVKQKLVEELRKRKVKRGDPEYYNFEDCKYLQACVKETLRLKVANITLRSVKKDIQVTTSTGEKYQIPKGDEITVASYVQHHDENVYENPYDFIPDRWMEQEFTDFQWFPFGAGTNKCSGRHLAQLELATVAGIVFSNLDIALKENIPENVWENCVAMVSPSRRSLKYNFMKKSAAINVSSL